MTQSLQQAKQLVAAALDINIDTMPENANVDNLLSWDSFGQMKIIMALESLCNEEVSDELIENLTSIKNISDYIEKCK